MDSYIDGQCTDRYGIAMNDACDIIILDEQAHIVLAYGSTVSGTGRFSVTVSGIDIGTKVLVAYSYRGNYGSVSDLAGAEFMRTTASGSV